MLCYHTSRRPADVMHDTFLWLSMNRVILRAMALPIMLLVTVTLTLFYVSGEAGTDTQAMREYILLPIVNSNPYTYHKNTVPVYYAILALGTSLIFVPLLIRYFVDRKSLQRTNIKLIAEALQKHPICSVVVSLMAAIGVSLIADYDVYYIMIPTAVAMVVILPYIMMWQQRPVLISGGWWRRLICVAYILLVCCITITLPWLAGGLFMLVIELFEKIMPGLSNILTDTDTLIDIFIPWCTSIGFCMSIIIFETSTLLLHGAMFEPRKPQ